MKNFKRLWEGFWQVADPKIWVASTVPMFVGLALAYYIKNSFNFLWFVIALIAIYLIEIGKNAINECIDYLSGVDVFVTSDKRTPFSGGKKTIVDKKLTVKENAVIGVVTISIAVLIGLAIVYFYELKVLIIGILGVFFAIFYSLPPFKFAYRGVGEFVVGFTFGILITTGVYTLMTREYSVYPVITGIPYAFLIANVLLINEFPDYEADKKGGKNNLVVRFGKRNSVIIFALFFLFAYIGFIFLTVYFKNPLLLIPILTLPLAVKAVINAWKNYENITVLIKSNALTVLIYQLTGVLLVFSFLISKILKIFI